MDLNSLSLTGRLARDPELRTTREGKPVTSFRMAANGYRDKVVWIDVTVWGRQAENVATYCGKGSRVAVKGRLEPLRTFEKQDGTTGAALEMTADDVAFLETTKGNGGNQAPAQAPATPPATPPSTPPATPPAQAPARAPLGGQDDDIPF